MRLLLAVVLTLHGLIHLMGTAKAFGWAELAALKQPIPPNLGVVWGLAVVLFVGTAAAVFAWPRGWWWLAAAAIAVSTIAIASSWSDARAGAAVNLVVAVAAVVAFLLDGPTSLRARYDRDAAAALAATTAATTGMVTEDDLAALPLPVARYLRLSGVVGRPRVSNFRARMHGRIRSGPDAGWMPLVVWQTTTLEPPVRLFYFDASMVGMAAPGYHRFAGGEAMMLVKALGLVTVAHDSGPAMARSETVTFLNDLCLLAPAALVGPGIRWEAVDDRHARATFTLGPHTITATLVFAADGLLADFWSDDRGRAQADGAVATGQRWSTPTAGYRAFGPFTLAARGEARWHPPEGAYAYIELDFDDVAYNVTTP